MRHGDEERREREGCGVGEEEGKKEAPRLTEKVQLEI
jgi:hypothetical protein